MVKVVGLIWGLKQSFRNYVEATGGTIAVGHGAERMADGAIAFVLNPDGLLELDDEGRLRGQGRFLGDVRFKSHGGMLSIHLSDPIVEVSETGAGLTVAVDEASYRVEIARLDLSAMSKGDAGEIIIPATLSMDGYQLLDSQYPLGTLLDPVRLICVTA